jgi:hypothetical protein
MSDVPYYLVPRKIKRLKERDRELHGAEIGGQMAAGFADFVNQKCPDLRSQLVELLIRHIFYIQRSFCSFQHFTPLIFVIRNGRKAHLFKVIIPHKTGFIHS